MSNTTPEGTDDESETGSLISISETDLANIHYSRETTIAAFKSYYDFLASMYMDAECIITPPEQGWPEITAESMEPLGKTEEAVELLRHLPYVRRPTPDDGTKIHAAGVCGFADWTYYARTLIESSNPTDRARHVLGQTQGSWDHIPSHVIGIVDSKDYQMFLDTRLGVIYFSGSVLWCSPLITRGPTSGQPFDPVNEDPYSYAPEEEAEWRGANGAGDCAWAIPEFFEVLKFHFRELNYIPMGREMVEESFMTSGNEGETQGPDDAHNMVRRIFREHGWPDVAQYDKNRCIQMVETKVEEHFPGTFFAL